jgi:hypothetical protein
MTEWSGNTSGETSPFVTGGCAFAMNGKTKKVDMKRIVRMAIGYGVE